ncbi:MAG: outer membrane beta-barrel protein [Verrucomicrobiia bacterium]
MNSGGRVSLLTRGLLLWLAATPVCRAAWDFTAPGEPSRNWSVSLNNGVQYDDNFNGTETDRQAGIQYTSDLTLRAKFPWERAFVAGQYDYGIIYPENNTLGGVEQTHNLNLSVNFSVNPRLLLSVTENFIDSVQPQLVQTAAGVPPTVIIAGAYIYDNVGASVSYSLAPRWSMSVAGSWDIWKYGEALYATNNNHEDYSSTLSLYYSIDPRTIVGVNYQYAGDIYTNPGFKNGLNASSNTGYLSLTHQFNPKLTLVLNGGYTVRDSEDGTTSTAPSAFGSLAYNYGPKDTISLVGAESLNSSGIGYNQGFTAEENESVALQVNHRFTARLYTVVEATYVHSAFTAEVLDQFLVPKNVTPTEDSITAHWGIRYDFRQWLSAGVDYYYTKLTSSEVVFASPYYRDQIGVSLTLTY